MADWTLDYFLRYQWTTGPVLRNNHSVDPGGSGIVKWRRSWWAWSQSAPPRSLWKTWHSWLPLSAMYSCWLQMVTAEYYYPLSNHLDHLCLQLAWRCPQLVEHNRRNRGPKETIKETVVITVNELGWLMQGLSRCCTNGQSQVSSLINKLNGDNKKCLWVEKTTETKVKWFIIHSSYFGERWNNAFCQTRQNMVPGNRKCCAPQAKWCYCQRLLRDKVCRYSYNQATMPRRQ